MRKPFYLAFLLALMLGVLLGCSSSEKSEAAAQPSVSANGASAAPTAEGKQMQYRAVCIEKQAHAGNEYVLSKWLDDKEKANSFGQYHGDFKEKGHRWRVDERVKPESKP